MRCRKQPLDKGINISDNMATDTLLPAEKEQVVSEVNIKYFLHLKSFRRLLGESDRAK